MVCNEQVWDQRWPGKLGCVWRSSVNCSNERKSAEHEKEQSFEDYYLRFGHAESQRKQLTQVCQDIILKLNQICFLDSFLETRHWFLRTILKPSASTVTGSVRRHWDRRKQKSKVKSRVDHILRYRGHHLQRVLAFRPDDKSVYLEILLYSVSEKRQEFLKEKSWLLHHNNLPAHNTLILSGSSGLSGTSPYWNNLSLHLILIFVTFFPKLKRTIKWTRFEGVS